MKVLIVGGGIGGLAAALSLHAAASTARCSSKSTRSANSASASTPCRMRSRNWRRWVCWRLDARAIRTRELIYANRFGQVVWRELRGTDAGFDTPQFSIHRGKLHTVLLGCGARAARRTARRGGAGWCRSPRTRRRPGGASTATAETEHGRRRRAGRRRRHPLHPARCSIPPRARRCGTAPCYGAAPPTGRCMSMAAPW